jgi:hypothetical protein
LQLPTHLIVGIVIQAVLTYYFLIPEWLSVFLTIIMAFFSHFLVDAIAKITYHPPDRIDDNFWLIWHVFLLLFGIVILLVFMWKYAIGMLFANLVDIWDWLTLRKIARRKGQPEWGKQYYLHPFANKIRSTFFFWLPNLSHNRVGILPEVLLYLSWIFLLIKTMIGF